MDAFIGFFSWLFNTRSGVLALVVGAIVLFLIIAFVLERRGSKVYFNHDEPNDDEDDA